MGEKYSILFGGKAGLGPNILTKILGEALVDLGYYVFYSRDYQSLIRGGHNFNVLTFSKEEVYSNESKYDVIVALDENTIEIHKKDLKKEGVILSGKEENMYYAGKIFAMIGISFSILEEELKKLKKNYDENLKSAKEGYSEKNKLICEIEKQKKKGYFLNGSEGIAKGAVRSGLDLYYAYPMTPATTVLTELAQMQKENNFLVFELENEIAVINAAIGSSITGAKSMVGTSGGGFDLMTESLSLAGIAEIPLVIYLSQRPGPGTGVATYTAQGDLNIARHSGHGEFPRVVLAPGDPRESQELVSQAFYFSQKYKIPAIVLSDKHLAESYYTTTEKAKIIKSNKSTKLQRFNSYEKDSFGSATEDAKIIKKNIEERNKKYLEIKKEAKKFDSYVLHGNPQSKNLVVSWGSTKGAIIDSIDKMDCKFLQILYIEPFSEKIKAELENSENIIIVENNSTSQLSSLISEKTGIIIDDKNKILRYDGRPFLSDELKKKIEEKIK